MNKLTENKIEYMDDDECVERRPWTLQEVTLLITGAPFFIAYWLISVLAAVALFVMSLALPIICLILLCKIIVFVIR